MNWPACSSRCPQRRSCRFCPPPGPHLIGRQWCLCKQELHADKPQWFFVCPWSSQGCMCHEQEQHIIQNATSEKSHGTRCGGDSALSGSKFTNSHTRARAIGPIVPSSDLLPEKAQILWMGVVPARPQGKDFWLYLKCILNSLSFVDPNQTIQDISPNSKRAAVLSLPTSVSRMARVGETQADFRTFECP